MFKGLTLALLSAALISLSGCGEGEKPINSVAQPAATQESPLSPLHFADVTSMIEDFGDYSVETGTFKLISDSPLEIQFAATVAAGDLPENVQRELRRAALYGVYRTFVHTDTGVVKVKAVPNLMTSATARSIQESPSLEVTVTRDQALQAVQSLVPAGSFSDLVLPERAGKIQLDNWTKSFEPLYFKDEGQQALLKAIQAKGGDLVNNG